MSNNLGYDATNPQSIEVYGKRMVGKTFADICKEDDLSSSDVVAEDIDYDKRHGNKKRKGGLGEIIEERFFHYQANNDARADFNEAGVDLKVSPYKINKDGSLSAKERLALTMIDYFSVVDETFEDSHMWAKSKLILLVYYLYRQETADRLDYRIDYVKLFTPPEEDVAIIKHDFETIQEKVRAGKAHELSESDTLYLGASPKASSSKDRREQPYSEELAKPRAFSFKNSYMTYVLNHYIACEESPSEQIISDTVVSSFEDYVVGKIDRYRNWSIGELCQEFDIDIKKKPKNLGAMIAYRILGIKGNHAEEFEKANIVIKTIRIGKNNKIREHMSFPTFKFRELVQEDWEDSTFGNYLRETRFLFVVYKFDADDELRLKGCQFWNIPYDDLEVQVASTWRTTKRAISNGLDFRIENGRYHSSLPSASDNPVCHVRPHGANAQDTYELPDGRRYPKQCFWLNKSYIEKQLEPSFFED